MAQDKQSNIGSTKCQEALFRQNKSRVGQTEWTVADGHHNRRCHRLSGLFQPMSCYGDSWSDLSPSSTPAVNDLNLAYAEEFSILSDLPDKSPAINGSNPPPVDVVWWELVLSPKEYQPRFKDTQKSSSSVGLHSASFIPPSIED